MKLPLATWLFVLLSSCSGKAQTTFGIKGGPNFSYMSVEKGINYSFHAGAFSKIVLNDFFFLQPELLYSGKGTTPGYMSAYDLECKLHYISMPVLVGWNVTDHLSVLAGPELDYLLDGSSFKYDDTKSVSSEEFASWDVAIDFGLAYGISKKFKAEVRYSLGLVDVIDIMFMDVFDRPAGCLDEGKNRTLQLSVSYVFASVVKKEE